jgi:hypothetical protein
MIRTLSLAALALLAACSNGGMDPLVGNAMDDLGEVLLSGVGREAKRAEQPEPLTREDIERADIAAIWARLEGDPAPTLMYAASLNGGYLTYTSQFRQSLTLRGQRVTATRGLGWDLLSMRSGPDDPLVRPRPPSQWPAQVQRIYEFPANSPQAKLETYVCSFEPGAPGEQVILQRRYVGVEIIETCDGPSGPFENHYFADSSTGFVWRSLQWIGPRMQQVDIQILEPYTGG